MEHFFNPPRVPVYFDIGQHAKDCLLRGFNIGMWRFDCTTTVEGFRIISHGQARPEVKDILGSLEIRKEFDDPLIKISTKLDNTKSITTELSLRELLSDGGEVLASFMGKYNFGADHTASLKFGYERSAYRVELITPLLHDRRLYAYALCVPKENWTLAYRMMYHWRRKTIDVHALGIGYYDGETEVALKLENFAFLRGSIFHRLNDKADIALKVFNFSGNETLQYVVGGQYRLRDDILLKLKIRDDGYLGFVFNKKLRDNIDVTYYVGVQSKNMFSHGHRVGVAWNFHC